MSDNIRIAPLANIPSEHQRYEYKTYLSLPKWYVAFLRNDYYKFSVNERIHLFPYLRAIKKYWSSYWVLNKFTIKKTNLYPASHAKVITLGLSLTAEFAFKCIYEKSIGYLTLCLGKGSQDEVMQKISREYAQFLKYHPWYEFEFFNRFLVLVKGLRTITENPRDIARNLERTIYFGSELLIKTIIALTIRIIFSLDYRQTNGRTAIELSYLPPVLMGDSLVDVIGEYNKHIVITVPRYFDFKTYVQELSIDNTIFSIAGNYKETLVSCILPKDFDYHKLPLEPVVIEKTFFERKLRVIYQVRIKNLIKFCKYCQTHKIQIEHIFDF